MSKWIEFIPQEVFDGRKTLRWQVQTREGGGFLGTVAWYGAWRKYGFYPDGETVFEEQCLRDIAAFCAEATTEHRNRKKVLP